MSSHDRSDGPILTINSGSSSLKFALLAGARDGHERLVDGAVEHLGAAGDGQLWTRAAGLAREESSGTFADHRAAIEAVFSALADLGAPPPRAVGHRLVHGGPHHHAPALVEPALLASLRDVLPFAPLHLPAELAGIDAVAARYPALAQVVSFDTAFHANMPELARRFALPERYVADGIRRYGFHGLSYDYIVTALGPTIGARTIVAHLGNGSSMVALREGAPIDTTMGLTPCGGMMMGTRSGDLDPGIIAFLLRSGRSANDIEHLVNEEAGLLGVSGTTSDMQVLLARRASDPRARLAVDLFCYHARKAIGALSAALGGLDLLVFTGGIGSHASEVREGICGELGHLGVELDRARNAAGQGLISAANARCIVRAMTTDEESVIARNVRLVLGAQRAGLSARTDAQGAE